MLLVKDVLEFIFNDIYKHLVPFVTTFYLQTLS